MNTFMTEALKEAYCGIINNEGGPFGCVIVKDDIIIGRGHNQVIANNDCTCHGEIQAIRDACNNLNTFNLEGCDLYTTAEPCPMCAGAIQWANIKSIYYGCNIDDTEKIGFRDKQFKKIPITSVELDRSECLQLFGFYSETSEDIY